MVCRGVNELVNLLEWETIIGTNSVQVNKIYADLPFANFLLNKHHIGQSLQVVHPHSKFCIHEYVNFRFNNSTPFWTVITFLLNDQFKVWVHI